MQLNSLQSDVTLSNTGAVSKFGMDANAKAFRVLSDTLYSNKIGSMVREVACNAWDSHVQAGCADRPIQIHLPNDFAPVFKVRDFGLGLDDAGVREVFTTYFRSTKDQSNDLVGAFGLGSKTPFAYTDAFTIVAIYNGMKRQYSAFIGGDGLPAITIMDESKTKEGNGVEIIVPVTKVSDFQRFRHEVSRQLTFFSVKPELLNVEEDDIEWMNWQDANQFMQCENVLVGAGGSDLRGLWILQGVVGYRMELDAVKDSLSSETREFLESIRQSAILRFNLGEIEVTPSRESVSFTPFTIANIEKCVKAATAALAKTVQAEIDAMPDAWTKAFTINTRETLNKLVRMSRAGFQSDAYYKSGNYYYLDLVRAANIENVDLDAVPDEDDETEHNVGEFLTQLMFKCFTPERKRGRLIWSDAGIGRGAKVDGSLRILLKDTSDKPVVRQREWLAQRSNSEQVYVLMNRDASPLKPDQIAKVQAIIGEGYKFTMMSDVDLPPPEARRNNGYKVPTAYTFGEGDSFSSTREWEREYEKITEFEEGAYWTIVDRQSLDVPSSAYVLAAMQKAGLLDKPIMAIRERDVPLIANNPLWVPLMDKVQEVIDEVTSNEVLMRSYALTKMRVNNIDCFNNDVMTVLRNAFEAGKLINDGMVHRLFRIERVVKKARERAAKRGFNDIARRAIEASGKAVNTFEGCVNKEISRLVKDAGERYPLVALLSAGYVGGRWMTPDKHADLVVDMFNKAAVA